MKTSLTIRARAPIAGKGAFKDGIPLLSPAEMAFADEPANPTVWGGTQGYTWQGGDSTDVGPGPTWSADMQRGPAHAKEPGWYLYDGDAAVQWGRVGGDWIDAADVMYGPKPFASIGIPAIPPGAAPQKITLDATTLVQKLITGKNYGIWLASSNGNTTRFASRFAASGTPVLRVTTKAGAVTIPCARSTWLSSALTTSASGDLSKPGTVAARQYIQVAGASAFGLLWFELQGITDVSAATLELWALSDIQYVLGNSTLRLLRIWNPGDLSTLAPQVLGIAQNYPLDKGLINHPAVQFHERYDDANYTKRALFLYGPNHSLQTIYVPEMGEPMLPGMNELRVQQKASIQKIGDTGNSAENSLVQFVWSPWRTNPQFYHAKPPKAMEEVYLRYLIRFWKTWKAQPSGGKLPGIDCRYAGYGTGFPGIDGMGAGNSGNPCTGFGGSVRMNHGARPPATSPHHDFQGVGASDCYTIDQAGNFGSLLMFGENYLGLLRLGTQNSVELHFKMNSVSDPTAKPRLLSSVTSDGSGKALATLVTPDPTLKNWPIVSTGNLASPTGSKGDYNVSGVVPTYINDSQFTYPIALGVKYTPGHLNGPSAPCAPCCVPSVAIPDGVVECWVNGRLAGGVYDARVRHSRFCLDGKTINAVDGIWGTAYQGGPKPPIGNGDMSLASVVVSDVYVGPPVLA